MNYRKLYESYSGKPIPKDYDVHHIDANRENNEENNLIALPKDFHSALHNYVGLLPKEPIVKLLNMYNNKNKSLSQSAIGYWINNNLDNVGVDYITKKKCKTYLQNLKLSKYNYYHKENDLENYYY